MILPSVRQVRRDAVERLGAAERDAESGHHFVEDQHARRAACTARASLPGSRRAGGTQSMLPATGSTMTAAMSVAAFSEQRRRSVEVVVRQRQREVGGAVRHARRGRHAEGQRAGAGLDQEAVAVAVIAALEFDDLAAAGEAARQAHGATSSPRCRS